MTATFKGGEKLQRVFAKAGKGGIESVDVGVFAGSKYPDGTSVAEVAAANEFGVGVPERPAIRAANATNEDILLAIIEARIDPLKMIVTQALGALLGESHKAAMQKSITSWRTPPNSPTTIAAKKSSNPLIDTGFYRNSITYKVNP